MIINLIRREKKRKNVKKGEGKREMRENEKEKEETKVKESYLAKDLQNKDHRMRTLHACSRYRIMCNKL